MIDYIKGTIEELTPTYVVLETAGVGYGIHIALTTYSALDKQEKAKLFLHEVIREDAHLLFGFMNKAERALFLLLISVSGVGANTARMILCLTKKAPDTQRVQIANPIMESASGEIAKKIITVSKAAKVGRNDPCTCGSGKKYKNCCGANR
jgi:Holliday junction DNA helicase RuvA subunit